MNEKNVMAVIITYELERLELLMENEILPAVAQAEYRTYALENLTTKLLEETDRIKKKFIQEVFALSDEKHLERYIQFHQQQLVRLLDLVTGIKTAEGSSTFALGSAAIASIQELMQFIEKHFLRYFDQDGNAPQSYVAIEVTNALSHLAQISERTKALSLDSQLEELILHPIRKFVVMAENKLVTYRQVMYVKEVTKEILRILGSENKSSSQYEEDIRTLFLYLNLNTLRYFRYFTSYVNSSLSELDTTLARIERLAFFLKLSNQTQIKPGVAYNVKVPNLKEQLTDWIAEEIAYLEKIQRLNDKNSTSMVPDDFRLQTEMSVSQLAYLVKIFLDTKIIYNKNVSELIRFFSRFFQTRKLERISYESFRVRYYNTEEGTRRSVRTILMRLVDHINKD